MKTLNVKRQILLVLAATFSFLLFTGCEKDPEMMGGTQLIPQASIADPMTVTGEGVLAAIHRDEPPLGYEEMKTVMVDGMFLGYDGMARDGVKVLEFEIRQVITHPDFFSKPIFKMPYYKVRNLLNHSLKCKYVLDFQAGTFPWRINGELKLNPNEEIDLGVLPVFPGVITDGIFTATILDLQIYDEFDGTTGSLE